jgi:ribonuclease J
MNITIYRGTKEIGGTLVEIKSADSRILIDAGYPLLLNGTTIDSRLAKSPIEKLLELGILPTIKGLYAWDDPAFDAVLISHAHLDHYGLLKYINPAIPVYMSEGTREIIRLSQLFKIVDVFTAEIRAFIMHKPFYIGDFSVKPYLMDHSAFDAAAFEISSEGKTIIYSGDFRGHGRKPRCIDRFIEGAVKNADVLLTEGTMLGRPDEIVITEKKLQDNLVAKMQHAEGLIIFQASGQNIDRLVTFYKAATNLKRMFVIDIYTANILSALRRLGNKLPFPSSKYPNIKVFYPYRLTRKIFNEIGKKYAWDFAPYRISREQIKESQNDIVMMVRPSLQKDLISCGLQDGSFIYSLWQGYRESPYQQNFEKQLKASGFETLFLHTSGHASSDDIEKVIKGLSPKKIVPIHTLSPDEFARFSDKVEQQQDGVEFEV